MVSRKTVARFRRFRSWMRKEKIIACYLPDVGLVFVDCAKLFTNASEFYKAANGRFPFALCVKVVCENMMFHEIGHAFSSLYLGRKDTPEEAELFAESFRAWCNGEVSVIPNNPKLDAKMLEERC
jgi:hypothetical protein